MLGCMKGSCDEWRLECSFCGKESDAQVLFCFNCVGDFSTHSMSYSTQVTGAFCHCPSARRTEERNKYGETGQENEREGK